MPEEKIFISYSSADRERVQQTVVELQRRGIAVWFDQMEIQVSDDIVRAIDAGLRSSKYMLIFASPSYMGSNWAQNEYSAFFYTAMNANERNVLIVRLDGVALDGLLAPRRHIDWTSPAAVAEQVAQAIRSLDNASPTIAAVRTPQEQLIRWDEIRNEIMDVLLQEFFDRYGDLMAKPGPSVDCPISLTADKTITMHISKIVACNEDIVADLRVEREKAQIAKYIINELSLKLMRQGLGIMEPAFKLEMESNQKKLDHSRRIIREQLEAIVPRVTMVTSVASMS
jgi:TIR domain